MCSLRANIVKKCRRCKSSVRLNCTKKKKAQKKIYADNKKKGASWNA